MNKEQSHKLTALWNSILTAFCINVLDQPIAKCPLLKVYASKASSSISAEIFQTQLDRTKYTNPRTSCLLASKQMLQNAGVSQNVDQKIQIANEISIDENTYKVQPNENASKGIEIIDSHLDSGRPIIVGVDREFSKGINDGTTDHWIVIVDKKFDSERQQFYYNFYDPGTEHSEKGTSNKNKLYIYDDSTIEGTSSYSAKTYTVSSVRSQDPIPNE